MVKLYEVANDYAKLYNDDSFTQEEIQDTLDAIEGELGDKVGNVLAIIKNLQSDAEALKAESVKLADRAKSALNKADSLKQYIVSSMGSAGLKKLSAGVQSVTVRAPSKKVNIVDVDKLPIELKEFETVIKPMTMEIKHLLNSGQEVPGAEIVTGKPSLLIK
ncbi:MAG: hypothetical protein [Bacteriophage sp.]|nr:MAG: hypothetical protein [Bacteriophage sp.]